MPTNERTFRQTLRTIRAKLWPSKKRDKWKFGTNAEKFTRIYLDNVWGDDESISGPGSNLAQTVVVRRELPKLVKRFAVKSLLDVPCGDFNWMGIIDLPVERYVGADIVDELTTRNNRLFADDVRQFVTLDLTSDALPRVDLILCRDCLVHLSNEDVGRALRNIRQSGSGYLLTTLFTDRTYNREIHSGHWRPLNLMAEPFQLPEPLAIFNENCPAEGCADKCLGLWQITDLPVV